MDHHIFRCVGPRAYAEPSTTQAGSIVSPSTTDRDTVCELDRIVEVDTKPRSASISDEHPVKHNPADSTRENWNGIFDEIVRLSDKLERLGIDEIMETDNV